MIWGQIKCLVHPLFNMLENVKNFYQLLVKLINFLSGSPNNWADSKYSASKCLGLSKHSRQSRVQGCGASNQVSTRTDGYPAKIKKPLPYKTQKDPSILSGGTSRRRNGSKVRRTVWDWNCLKSKCYTNIAKNKNENKSIKTRKSLKQSVLS